MKAKAPETLARRRLLELLRESRIDRLGGRITANRARTIWEESLPAGEAAVVVGFTGGKAEIAAQGTAREYWADCTLEIEVLALAGEDADDLVDEVAEDVRQALFRDTWLGGEVGVARDVRYQGFRSGLVQAGGRFLAAKTLVFSVSLEHLAPEVGEAPDLEAIQITEAVGPEGTPVLEQEIVFEHEEVPA